MSERQPPLRVKICGVTSPGDARAAAQAGAFYVGAVHVPGTPRHVEPDLAASIAEAAGKPLVLVVAGGSADRTVEAARRAGASVIQMHGGEGADVVRAVRKSGPWDVWVVVRVRTAGEARDRIAGLAGRVDGILLDTWEPRRLGGTGRRFPWRKLSGVRELFPASTQLVVAGGLRPENVGEAVQLLRPDVVDVSSGVESSPGRKSPEKMREFVRAAHSAGGHADAERARRTGTEA